MNPPFVLVTGGGRGIGAAIALRFAREGATVVVAARSTDQLEAVARAIDDAGGTGIPLSMDVTDASAVQTAVTSMLERTSGRLDVLVNNAGVFDVVPFADLSLETWRNMQSVNLDGPFHVTRAALGPLEKSNRGHVFNISSVAGRQPFEGSAAYCATKYGLRGLSDVLRLELAPLGIRVSTVYPGATDTSIFDGVEGDWDRSTMNRPTDVAEVVWKAWASPPETAVDDLDIPPPQ